jgi:hypothetical protein
VEKIPWIGATSLEVGSQQQPKVRLEPPVYYDTHTVELSLPRRPVSGFDGAHPVHWWHLAYGCLLHLEILKCYQLINCSTYYSYL